MYVCCEWGLAGMQALLPAADVIVVVDVLSFSTCVDVACSRGAQVFPFPYGDPLAAREEADRIDAVVAGRRSDPASHYSLSAPTLLSVPSGTRLVLPSPNGSRISFSAKDRTVVAGCLRNASAVAEWISQLVPADTIAVIPAGEHWKDGTLRPALEDLLGAGAIISALKGKNSPEADAAVDVFAGARDGLRDRLFSCNSGRELVTAGFPQDVEIAACLDMSACAPVLSHHGCFADAKMSSP